MPIQINGSGTITGITAGGYPDATVTADDLAATLDLSGKTVTLPSGVGGKILQVTQNTDTSQAVYTTAPSNHDIFSGTITPLSSTSDILVIANFGIGKGNNETWYLKRGSDKIGGVGGTDTTYIKFDSWYSTDENPSPNDNVLTPVSFVYLDTARSEGTSQLTYTIGAYLFGLSSDKAVYNRPATAAASGRMTSTITLMEYAT